MTGIAERGSSSVIRYWVQEPSSEARVKRQPQARKKRVLGMIFSVALGLALFAALHNQKPQWLRHMESQPERWLQWAWSGGNNRPGIGHVPPYPWEFQDGDDGDDGGDDLLDRLRLGDGPFDRRDIGGEL